MKKQQFFLIAIALVLLCVIYFFGNTVPPKKSSSAVTTAVKDSSSFNIDKVLAASKAQLPASLATHIEQLESSVATADNNAKAGVYRQIADIYRDSAHMLLPFAWYTGEAAKLESSEKNLTFAARFFLESARTQHDNGLKNWMAGESKQLFERALALNPNNDSLKVGLGSTYFYGSFASNPMQGIMMIREVAEKDPSNMYAQYMLGIGGMMSGQIDRAIERFKVVAENQPENVEVSIMLAEAYDRKGDKTNAIKWYEFVKGKINNPDIVQELDQRIQSLKK